MPGPAADDPDDAERTPTFVEQARRRQIVDATIDVLAEVGYAGATFARIAERAGISPPLISYHFTSKDRLLHQVYQDVVASMDAALTAEMEDAPSYAEALRRLVVGQVRYFAEHTREVLALGQLHAAADEGEMGAMLAGERESSIVELESLFAEGQAEGELRAFPTRPMAITLLAALEAVPSELLSGEDVDVDEYANALADTFVLAVGGRLKRSRSRRR